MTCRVIEDRLGPDAEHDGRVHPSHGDRHLLRTAIASYKRFATRHLPRERLRVIWGDRVYEGHSDEEGFLELWVEPPPKVAPGWARVRLEHLPRYGDGAAPGYAAEAEVFIVGDQAELGVISDIDDTVIDTGATNPLKRAYALFLSEARMRLPFEGVSAFYEALQAGRSGRADNPIFYVSSSPWNLYEHLDEFFRINGIVPGPFLLRDWGISRHEIAPGGGHGHKLAKIRRILDTFPRLRFVLIGDDGQQDADHYSTIAIEYPGRIAAIYIRAVTKDRDRATKPEQIVPGTTVPLVVCADTAEAARHAAAHGFIRPPEITHVEAARVRDEAASGLLDTLSGS